MYPLKTVHPSVPPFHPPSHFKFSSESHFSHEPFPHTGCSVFDYGDLTFEDVPRADWNTSWSVACAVHQVAKAVCRVIRDGHTCVTLGGDHSLALGSVFGHSLAQQNPAVIWVDAHADVNTPLTSRTGNLHGQPVAFLLHELQDKIPSLSGFSWLSPCLSARDIVYIGLRDVDPAEHFILKNYGLQYFSTRHIDELGIHKVMEMTLDYLIQHSKRSIHLSFDIDAFDPSLAPATGTPVPGGLTLREGLYIAEELHNSGALSALDLVEVNPRLGSDPNAADVTLDLAMDVILSCLGKVREGMHTKGYRLPCPSTEEREEGEVQA
uniref:Arginase n=1 Tax=Eptatretus burgeri TaxID=7764 RepID=A0A8C4QUA5_EPTBU